MEEEYSRLLEEEMMSLVGNMNELPPSTFTGEEALQLFLKCVKLGSGGYVFKMSDIDHQLMIRVLVGLRDIGLEEGSKKTPIREELEEMNLMHLSQYITCKKNGLYDINIRDMNFATVRKLIAILFTW